MRLFSLLFILSIPLAVQAELYECGGVWTNKPCGASAVAQIPERSETPRSPADALAAQKRLWLNDLDLQRSQLKRKYKKEFPIGDVEGLCEDSKTSLVECRKAISAREREFEEREIVLLQRDSAVQGKREREEFERNELRVLGENSNSNSLNSNAVVIIENNTLNVPCYGRGCRRDRLQEQRDYHRPRAPILTEPGHSAPQAPTYTLSDQQRLRAQRGPNGR